MSHLSQFAAMNTSPQGKAEVVLYDAGSVMRPQTPAAAQGIAAPIHTPPRAVIPKRMRTTTSPSDRSPPQIAVTPPPDSDRRKAYLIAPLPSKRSRASSVAASGAAPDPRRQSSEAPASAPRSIAVRQGSQSRPASPSPGSTAGIMNHVMALQGKPAPRPSGPTTSALSTPLQLHLPLPQPVLACHPAETLLSSGAMASPSVEASIRLQHLMLSAPVTPLWDFPTGPNLVQANLHPTSMSPMPSDGVRIDPSDSSMADAMLRAPSHDLSFFSTLFDPEMATSAAPEPRLGSVAPPEFQGLDVYFPPQRAPSPGVPALAPTQSIAAFAPFKPQPTAAASDGRNTQAPPARSGALADAEQVRQRLPMAALPESMKWLFHRLTSTGERRNLRNVLVLHLPFVPVLELQQFAFSFQSEAEGRFNMALDPISQQVAVHPANELLPLFRTVCSNEHFVARCFGEGTTASPVAAVTNAAKRLARELNPQPFSTEPVFPFASYP